MWRLFGKRPRGRQKCRWEIDVELSHGEMGFEGGNWMRGHASDHGRRTWQVAIRPRVLRMKPDAPRLMFTAPPPSSRTKWKKRFVCVWPPSWSDPTLWFRSSLVFVVLQRPRKSPFLPPPWPSRQRPGWSKLVSGGGVRSLGRVSTQRLASSIERELIGSPRRPDAGIINVLRSHLRRQSRHCPANTAVC